jgi:DNA-binding NarL/FixJ family response regulator/signal transduction histidine kinase
MRQRQTIRPLGTAIIVLVAIGTFSASPAPSTHGKGLVVAAALAVFVVALAVSIRDWFIELALPAQIAAIATMGAAGVVLAGLQAKGASELAAGSAVWMAVARLPRREGTVLGVLLTAGLDIASAISGASAATVLAAMLLCAMLALVAHFLGVSRDSQEQTELLMAQLEDAREEQTRAAAIAERGRIASELHDVLAHTLSGAAIQLQGARLLAEREGAGERVRSSIDRASELVRDGLGSARQAVGALRGEELPGVAQLGALVEGFRADMHVEVELTTLGTPRSLAAEASLALYRGAQEALTNVARYAPGAATTVTLSYASGRTTLSIEDTLPGVGVAPSAERRGAERRGRRPRAGRHARAGGARRRRDACGADAGGLARRARGAGLMIRVALADDQRVVRDGLAMLVGLIDGVEVVGVAADGVEAVELARRHRPDVMLMDLRMPRMEGAEATREILASLPETQVLVLTTYADDDALFPALRAGARGYLTKDASAEEIEHAIRALADGHTHPDAAVQQRLLDAVLDAGPAAPATAQPHEVRVLPDELTTREAEVLKLIAEGLSNAEIAAALVVSAATVKTHVNRIFYKTGARDRAQAVRYAYQHGLA